MERALQNYVSLIPKSQDRSIPASNDQSVEEMMALGLTRREAEILDLIKNGLTNEEISEKLFVSKNTIKFHIKNIYIKLDVKNRAQALKMAFVQ